MELKPGYKETEIGFIPIDWELSIFGDLVNYTKGYAFKSSEYRDFGIRVIRVSDTTFDSIHDTNAIYISEGSVKTFRKWQLNEGDLIFSTVGSKPPMYDSLVGKAILIPKEYSGSLLNQNAVLIRAKEFSDYFQKLLLNHFRTARYIDFIEKIFRGNANQASITLENLFQYKIPLPRTKEEQRAIATALSDVDALLDGLDRLIAKKRDLKQAAMQQLLTGETRLPGFEGEWEVKRLGSLGVTYGGLTGKTKADFGVGSSYYVTFLNVMTNVVINCSTFDRVKLAQSELQNRVKCGDLLFNGSSETPEEVAMCALVDVDIPNLYLNSFCFGFRFHEGTQANGLFMAYYIRSHEGREIMKSLAQGSTRYNLSKNALLKATLRLPSPHEQTAIATVLSDMDAEIAALEQRRNKTKDIKQAMMQELLTGKTRLVTPGGSNA